MQTTLKRRIAPSVRLTLALEDQLGNLHPYEFLLCFDFNAIALIEERTGIGVLDGEIWSILQPKKAGAKETLARNKPSLAATISVMFWAVVQANHPELEGEEGLRTIRSHMDPQNTQKILEGVAEAFAATARQRVQEAAADPLAQRPEAASAKPSASSKSGRSRATTSASPMTNSAA